MNTRSSAGRGKPRDSVH